MRPWRWQASPPKGAIRRPLCGPRSTRLGPKVWLTITVGRGGELVLGMVLLLTHSPILPVRVEGTAGAGDAHLAGTPAGLAAGLPLREAHQLGVLDRRGRSAIAAHDQLRAGSRGAAGARRGAMGVPSAESVLGVAGPTPAVDGS